MNISRRKIISSVFLGGLSLACALGAVYIFIRLIDLWLLVFLALIIALFMSFFVDFFHRKFGFSRITGLIITVAVLLTLSIAFIFTLAPVFIRQGRMVLDQLPTLIERLQILINSLLARIGSKTFIDMGDIAAQFFSQTGGLMSQGLSLVGAGISGVLELIVLIVIALYFAVRPLDDPRPLLRWFPQNARPRAEYIFRRIIKKLRAWLLGQLFSMTVIALFYSIGLAIIGVPNALFFGILAGILCFIPYLGPPASTIGPLMFALAESPIKALWVMLLYIGSQNIESYFLTPMVMRRQVRLHPVATIISIMAMGELFGILGIAVAVPVVASLQFVVEELYLKEISLENTPSLNVKDSQKGDE